MDTANRATTGPSPEGRISMAKSTVFNFAKYDPKTGSNEQMPRMATRDAIENHIYGRIDESSAKEVDESELDGNGFYNPRAANRD